MNPNDWWGHGFGFMWIVPMLFFVVFLFFMRGIFRQGSRGGNNGTRRESAREILDKRFAKGEIEKEEYEEMKKAIGNGS